MLLHVYDDISAFKCIICECVITLKVLAHFSANFETECMCECAWEESGFTHIYMHGQWARKYKKNTHTQR